MAKDHFIYEIPDSAGDNILCRWDQDGEFMIQIEEPWAGDTETGFGQSTTIYLPKIAALKLAEFIVKEDI